MSDKTIFLAFHAGGFHLRPFLQQGAVKRMEETGHTFVFLLPSHDTPALRETLSAPCFRFETLDLPRLDAALRTSRLSAFFRNVRRYVFGNTLPNEVGVRRYLVERLHSKEMASANFNGRLYYRLMLQTAFAASRWRWARRLLLAAEKLVMPFDGHAELYRRYRPAMVVVGSLGFLHDSLIMREAHSHGTKTTVVIKNWDLPTTRGISGCAIDHAVAWHPVMRDELVRYHDMRPENIRLGGIPQWDSYFLPIEMRGCETFLRDYGLRDGAKILYFAMTTPTLFYHNFAVARVLLAAIKDGRIKGPCQLLVRLHPHYLTADYQLSPEIAGEVEALKAEFGDLLAMSLPHLEGDGGVWVYSDINQTHLKEILTYCDVMVTIYSTQIIEAALFDKPIINAGLFNFSYTDLPISEYESWEHIRHFDGFDGMVNAHSEPALIAAANEALENPALRAEGRRKIADQQYLPELRGCSGTAMVDALIDLL